MYTSFASLAKERVASIREIQTNPSRALRGITRVIRGRHTVGFFLDLEEFHELVEDQEALASKVFQTRIRRARREMDTGKGTSLARVARRYAV